VGPGLAGADLGGQGATGLGHLPDWQLVAAGEAVLDVQPKLAARVRFDKITPLDQPGSCWSHRHRPALISMPDTS
jgi:hypothetical protein